MTRRERKNFGPRFQQAQERFLFDRGERPTIIVKQVNPSQEIRLAIIGGLFVLLAAYITKN
jgi:hypothetical protein